MLLPKYGENVLTFIELCHGCGACSYLCPEKAIIEVPHEIGIIETGKSGDIVFGHGKLSIGQAMAPPVIRQVKRLVDKDHVVIIDASPGTSCPVVETIKGSDFCLLVTEPTPFGLNDLILAVETVRELGIPAELFSTALMLEMARHRNIALKRIFLIMMTIPLDTKIASLYSRGVLLVEGMPEYKRDFIELYQKIKEVVL